MSISHPLSYVAVHIVSYTLQVMSVKAIGIAIKLTLDGANQFKYFQAWVFAMVSVTCIIIQLNYLNMVGIPCYVRGTTSVRKGCPCF